MKIDVIIPVRNQTEKLLRNLASDIIPYFDGTGLAYDILICADHSSQEELEKLQKGLASMPAQVKLLPYEDKPGKGWAVQKGILASDGDYVLFMDADLSTDLHVFDTIKLDLGKYDAFIGSRDVKGAIITEKQTFVRRITHWGAKTVIKNKFHLKTLHDTQCGYKIFRSNVAKLMAKHQIIAGFAFDVEYCYFLSLNGFSIKEVPVQWENDPDSSVSPFKASLNFYKALGKIKKNKKNYLLSDAEWASLGRKKPEAK
ncbi:MAG: Glycosyl transferase family 2 [Tenericutes bacterium ADurb.BinA155]|jgi:dolichyl-phosphate beta-glucosyltransferase|nr:MAG: Glycosyl transferase family 2 [Tenericutes bacterium ADurb.BinA155]